MLQILQRAAEGLAHEWQADARPAETNCVRLGQHVKWMLRHRRCPCRLATVYIKLILQLRCRQQSEEAVGAQALP